MNPSHSASAEDRRHDGVLCALIGLGAFLLIGGSWSGAHALAGALSALLALALALGLRWRLPGSLASRMGIALIAALMASAIEVWAPRVLSERASGAVMPVVLALLLPYRD